jgi:hypothetical protein
MCVELLRENGAYRVIREAIGTEALAWAERL